MFEWLLLGVSSGMYALGWGTVINTNGCNLPESQYAPAVLLWTASLALSGLVLIQGSRRPEPVRMVLAGILLFAEFVPVCGVLLWMLFAFCV